MTYEEIKDRLSKCEIALNSLKNGNHTNLSKEQVTNKVEKLQVLKESYKRLLKEADDMEDNGYVATDDEDKAEDLAKKGVKVKLTNEQEGIEFSKEETRVIAKKVGEALIKALREVGDEIETVKGRNIEPNSFEIYVKYKNDFEDEFSFYISEDTLHLVDFSFDKGIGEVGVKPSGEAIVHVDVIKNNLVKHFKSLNEQEYVKDIEVQADEEEEYEKLKQTENQSNEKYLDKLFNIILKYTKDPNDAEEELDNYISQGYQGFSIPLQANLSRDMEFISLTQQEHDEDTFRKEINEEETDRQKYLRILDMYKRAGRIDREAIKPKLEKAAQVLGIKLQLNEAPEGMYYIKVAVRDARQAIGILDDKYYKNVIFSGSDTYYFNDEQTAYDVLEDFGANDIEILDTNLDLFAENQEKDDYGRTGMEPRTFVDPEDMTVSARAEKLLNKEDVDIGHQDDEPDMLKQSVYDIATYAAKLYKQLDKYDKMDAEVDFPNWWQSKVILAKDYISKAQHYLEFEEKQPALDALALEGKEGASKEKEEEFHEKLDDLVHKTFGKREEELEENINPEVTKLVNRFVGGLAKRYDYDKQSAVNAIMTVLRQQGWKGVNEEFNPSIAPGSTYAIEVEDLGNKVALKQDNGQAVVIHKDDVDAVIENLNSLLESLNEQKATCCGKCGRVHVKGTKCKRPFLTGKDHCRNN